MRVLLFQSKRLSYDSSWCFMEMLRRGMEQCGVCVKLFLVQEDIAGQEEELKKLTGETFDGIFDVNSLLPHVILDDRHFLDYFDAPFYHLIVDHPMHVHNSLQIPLKQYRVICLDRYHKKYLERYYPHIERVYVLPFGGIPASEFLGSVGGAAPMKERKYDLLFPGTYTPLDYYRMQMDSVSDSQPEIADAVLEKYRQGSPETIDELFAGELAQDRDFFAWKMHRARLVDRYVREWYRESVLRALLRAGLRVDVAGFRWELFPVRDRERLCIHPPCAYPEQLALLGQSRIVLNVQPLFLDGVHDRVVNTMANHSVALTDRCEFVEKHFSDGQELLLFDKNQPEEMAQRVAEILQDLEYLEEMAERAESAALQQHTWYSRTEALLRSIS